MSLSEALEGKHHSTILDGNIDRDFIATALRAIDDGSRLRRYHRHGGAAARLGHRRLQGNSRSVAPTANHLGGAFPTVCPDATLSAPYVDYAVRAQGEDTLTSFWIRSQVRRGEPLTSIAGIELARDGQIVHNKDRLFSAASLNRMLPYDKLENPQQYLTTNLPRAAHGGLSGGAWLPLSLHLLRGRSDVSRQDGIADRGSARAGPGNLKTQFGADAVQFYDHNFFDREVDMVPLLEVLAKLSCHGGASRAPTLW